MSNDVNNLTPKTDAQRAEVERCIKDIDQMIRLQGSRVPSLNQMTAWKNALAVRLPMASELFHALKNLFGALALDDSGYCVLCKQHAPENGRVRHLPECPLTEALIALSNASPDFKGTI